MSGILRRKFVAGLWLLIGLSLTAHTSSCVAQANESALAELSGMTLIEALRQGGYTIFFRHEATNWSQSDHIEQLEDWLSCDGSRVRQLSVTGRQNARATGEAMRKLEIPVTQVLASPYCRTMETARLMNLGEVRPSNDVINMRVADYFGGRSAVIATAQALLSQTPEPDGNTVIVAHGNVASSATPVYPGEGEAVIFQSNAKGGFRFIGRLSPAQWRALIP